jgi:hypothetical protein
MKPKMKLTDKIESVFSSRLKPAQVSLPDELLKHVDSDVEDALWFSGRDWHELTWLDWQHHSSAIFFFDADAFAYYLPSVLILSAQQPNEWMNAAHSLVGQLDRSPDPSGWTEDFASRFLGLNRAELNLLKEWLLYICEYDSYRGYGPAGSGPGETFGRAFDTLDLLEKEVERRSAGGG